VALLFVGIFQYFLKFVIILIFLPLRRLLLAGKTYVCFLMKILRSKIGVIADIVVEFTSIEVT